MNQVHANRRERHHFILNYFLKFSKFHEVRIKAITLFQNVLKCVYHIIFLSYACFFFYIYIMGFPPSRE
jgi:hypothetical protein